MIRNLRIIAGYKDIRKDEEDLMLTPYLFRVWVKVYPARVIGIGIGWGYASAYVALGLHLPTEYPTFTYEPYKEPTEERR